MRSVFLNVKNQAQKNDLVNYNQQEEYIDFLSVDVNEPDFVDYFNKTYEELQNNPIRIASATNHQDLVYNSLLIYYDVNNYNHELAFKILASLCFYRPQILKNFKLNIIYLDDLSRMITNLHDTEEQAMILLQLDFSELNKSPAFYEIIYQLSTNKYINCDFQPLIFKYTTDFQIDNAEIINTQLLILQQLLIHQPLTNLFYQTDFQQIANLITSAFAYNALQCIYGLQTIGIELAVDVSHLLSPYHTSRTVELALHLVLTKPEPSQHELSLSVDFLASKNRILRRAAALIAEKFGANIQLLVRALKLEVDDGEERYIKALLRAVLDAREDVFEMKFCNLGSVLEELRGEFGVGVEVLIDEVFEVLE